MDKEIENKDINKDKFNRNDKQLNFNKIKGTISELNSGEKFCSVTLLVGHENLREVNVVVKKSDYEYISQKFSIGSRVYIKYYLTSRFKHGRWYTMANSLSMDSQD
jgi:hypothetical protein